MAPTLTGAACAGSQQFHVPAVGASYAAYDTAGRPAVAASEGRALAQAPGSNGQALAQQLPEQPKPPAGGPYLILSPADI